MNKHIEPDDTMNTVPRKEFAEQVYEGMRTLYGPEQYRLWSELGPLTRSRFLMMVTEMENIGLIDVQFPEHNP
jgi:hypothetical protein